MSEKNIDKIRNKMEKITGLRRAPSQRIVFFHLLGRGKTLTVSEIAKEVELTHKATERAVAKLLEKELIQRAPFKAKSYTVDSKEITLCLLLTVTELKERLDKKGI
jgi:predicted transcriptional regulator